MRIIVQNRKTNTFLTGDARWARQLDYAKAFTTSLEALRFCADRHLTQIDSLDLLVCYPGARPNLRLPLC